MRPSEWSVAVVGVVVVPPPLPFVTSSHAPPPFVPRPQTALGLAGNPIGAHGLALLASGLRAHCALARLNLRKTELDDKAGYTIAALLREGCPFLTELDMSWNALNGSAAAIIHEVAVTHPFPFPPTPPGPRCCAASFADVGSQMLVLLLSSIAPSATNRACSCMSSI